MIKRHETQAHKWAAEHLPGDLTPPPNPIRAGGFLYDARFGDQSRITVRWGSAWSGERNPPTPANPKIDIFWPEDAKEGHDTPWGRADSADPLCRGVTSVGTPSHGGIMVHHTVAQARLSEAARKRALRCGCGQHLCFEEDCAACIPLWELDDARATFFGKCLVEPKSEDQAKASLLKSLSGWNADYLLEIGVQPEPEAYARWQADQLDTQMRQGKHPNLIVSASSSVGDPDTRPIRSVPLPKGVVMVLTAAGNIYFVTSDSYERRETPNLLSSCKLANGWPQGETGYEEPARQRRLVALIREMVMNAKGL